MKLVSFAALALAALLTSPTTMAQAAHERYYTLLTAPQPPESAGGKVEVIEFFSYACPHCFHFSSLVMPWAAKLPQNAIFLRVPVAFGRPEWGALVRAYYALQATGDLDRLDAALFDAIHKEHQPLFNEANITEWVARQGVKRETFAAAYNSFNVTTKATHAGQLAMNYQVDGVPKLVIGGKYIVQGSDFQQLLTNADQVLKLIETPAAGAGK